jgi:hypothetical protein
MWERLTTTPRLTISIHAHCFRRKRRARLGTLRGAPFFFSPGHGIAKDAGHAFTPCVESHLPSEARGSLAPASSSVPLPRTEHQVIARLPIRLIQPSISVWAEQPIFPAIDTAVAQRDGCSPSCSTTILTARARISAPNLFAVLLGMAPSYFEVEASENPVRFSTKCLPA